MRRRWGEREARVGGGARPNDPNPGLTLNLTGWGQVYTSNLLTVSEEGVKFRSYRNGEHVMLTPESSVEIQKALGADIIIPLDELLPSGATRERLEKSLALTHRWEARSLLAHLRDVRDQAMYGVIHGGGAETLDLRQQSLDYLTALPFDGFAVGGAVGFREQMETLLQYVLPRLPTERPNHLLGIADMESIELAVPLGVPNPNLDPNTNANAK